MRKRGGKLRKFLKLGQKSIILLRMVKLLGRIGADVNLSMLMQIKGIAHVVIL